LFTRVCTTRRSVVVAALLITIAMAFVAPAQARSPVQAHRAQERRAGRDLAHLRRRHQSITRRWASVIHHSDRVLQLGPGRGGFANPGRWNQLENRLRQERWVATKHIHRSRRLVRHRLATVRARQIEARAWLDTWGIFQVCPIQGWNDVADNFGITVRLPGVPVHRHMGNDIAALTGTPIVAPFDGYATASAGELGGLEVRVYGDLGYVYNAHLSRVGTLGTVRTGEVIGYVGSTGDATAPHDHFEWHPGDGVAVDPYPYLSASCG
jgi:murein DD-endopeptidase MepM/ murein hydrolase activator NlpD